MLYELYTKKNRLTKKIDEAKKLSSLLEMEKNVYSSFPDFGYVVDDTSISKNRIVNRHTYASKNKSYLDNSIIPSIMSDISDTNQSIYDEENKPNEEV